MRAPNGIVEREASQLDLETFYRLRGRCAPKGGWLFLGGTFESSLGWYPQTFSTWESGVGEEQSFSLPSYSNFHLYPGGRDDPEIRRLEAFASDDFLWNVLKAALYHQEAWCLMSLGHQYTQEK